MKRKMKVISSLLALIMVFTAVPYVAPRVNAAQLENSPTAWVALTKSTTTRGDNSKITVCSDGSADNTTVGLMKFDIRDVALNCSNVTLTLKAGHHGGGLANSQVEIYSIDPGKYPNTQSHQTSEGADAVLGSNFSGTNAANSVYAYYGVDKSAVLYTINQASVGTETANITEAVKEAKAKGQTELCLLLLNPRSFDDGNSSTWSDVNIFMNGSNISFSSSLYGTEDAPAPDGTIKAHRVPGNIDVITVNYPTNIYLDVNESLQSAGYRVEFVGAASHFGDSDMYRIGIMPAVWGGEGSSTKDRTFLDTAFEGYGGKVTSNSVAVENESYIDKENKVFLQKSGHNNYEGFSIYLQGRPKGVAGTSFTYTVNEETLLFLFQTYNNSVFTPGWEYTQRLYSKTNGDCLEDVLGNPNAEISMTAHFYDKSELNRVVEIAEKIKLNNQHYTQYVVLESWQNFARAFDKAKDVLKQREVTQEEIDNAVVTITNAINGLEFKQDISRLNSIITSARNIYNKPDYELAYTSESRQSFETAFNEVQKSGVFDEKILKVNINDPETYNLGSKLANERDAVTQAETKMNAAVRGLTIANYTIKFVNAAGDELITYTKAYSYGTLARSVSKPTENTPGGVDAQGHYTYSWPVVENVTGDKTYTEIKNSKAHVWSEPVLITNPTADTQGEYLLTCTIEGCLEEKRVPVSLADYSEIDSLIEALNSVKNNNNLTDEALGEIDRALEIANNLDRNLIGDAVYNNGVEDVTIKGEQDTVNASAESIKTIKNAIDTAVADGTGVKADYSAYNELLNELNSIDNADSRYEAEAFNRAKAEITAIDSALSKNLNNTPENQAVIDNAIVELRAQRDVINSVKSYFVSFLNEEGASISKVKFNSGVTFGTVTAPTLPENTTDFAYVGWSYIDGAPVNSEDILESRDYTLKPLKEGKRLQIKEGNSLTFSEDNTYILGLNGNSSLQNVVAMFSNDETVIEIKSFEGALLNSSDLVGTGSTITLKSKYTGEIYDTKTFVIMGDVNGDGVVNDLDYQKSKSVNLEAESYPQENNYFFLANDLDGDGIIDVLDSFLLKQLYS